MSQSHRLDVSIDTHDRFRHALEAVLATASANNVHIEGSYGARSREGRDLTIEITEDVSPPDRTSYTPVGDRTPNDLGTLDITSRTSLVQVLTGLPLARSGGRSTCSVCGADLRDGETATSTARKPIEGFRWEVDDLFCRDCSRSGLQHPRYGRTDALYEATVTEASNASEQGAWKVAGDVRILDYSPPSEGAIRR